jgi:DNA topoisomerase VI subunit B
MSDYTTLTNPLTSISLDSTVSTTQQLQGIAAATATQTAANALYSQINTQITTAASLKVKILTNTATAAEVTQYNTAIQAVSNLTVSLNNTAAVDPDTASAINQQLQQQKLTTIKGAQSGTLTMVQFTNFLDYLYRTQAINPYSRQRTCDNDFVDMMYNVSQDIDQNRQFLQDLQTIIANSISAI